MMDNDPRIVKFQKDLAQAHQSIEKLTKEIDQLLRNHPAIDQTQTIMVNFVEFADSSLNINIYAFTKTTDWAKFRDAQQDIFLKSIAIIVNHGAECAFPTTTVIMQNDYPSREQFGRVE